MEELRQALAIAHWSSWAQLAFIPVGLAWVLGWVLLFLVKRVRSRPQAGNEHYPQIANAEDNNEQHGKKDYFPAPWTVEKIAAGFKVCDANGQSLAYVYSSENPHDAFMRKVLTLDDRASPATSPSCQRCLARTSSPRRGGRRVLSANCLSAASSGRLVSLPLGLAVALIFLPGP